MKQKTLCLLLLLPIIFVLIVFTSANFIKLPIDLISEKLVLEHEEIEFFPIKKEGDRYRLYAYATPAKAVNSQIIWSVEDEEIAYIDDNYLVSKGLEGQVRVNARTKDNSLKSSFVVEIYIDGGTTPKAIRLSDPTLNTSSSISSENVYGMYDVTSSTLTAAKLSLKVTVLPQSAPQDHIIEVIEGNASVDNQIITINDSGKVTIKVTSAIDNSIYDTYTYTVIDGGVNVYNYQDLMYCTNKSQDGEIVVLRTNLESLDNCYNPDGAKGKNTELFGRMENDKLVFDPVFIESTYDVQYLKNTNQDTKIAVAVNFKKDVYGNGFTINLHELCYCESAGDATVAGDVFKGPLPFVSILSGIVVAGQDNIGFLVSKDNVTIDNISLRNANAVSDLTKLDYVGTTLEVIGDNVKIKNSILSNGLTVLRSFSNENLVVDGCILQMGREFIFKIGSNEVIKPALGLGDLSNKPIVEKYQILSPTPYDKDGKLLSDSSATINNCHFYKSGFFSIGIDTHFAGEVLYGNTAFSTNGVSNLAGTSYASRLTIKGDTRFYDWKSIDSLDSSTLIRVNDELAELINSKFNVANIITSAASNTPMEVVHNNKSYVHGGIAFFGGGRNESILSISELSYKDFHILDKILIQNYQTRVASASGYGPFKFYTYQKGDNNFFNKSSTSGEVNYIPNLEEIISCKQ